MTREEAMETFRRLVARHGLEWTPHTSIPQADWDLLAEVNKVLTTTDRREALGLRGRQTIKRRGERTMFRDANGNAIGSYRLDGE